MTRILAAAVTFPIICCLWGCGQQQKTAAPLGRGAGSGGSTITANSGSPFTITVTGSTWSCPSSSDCYTTAPVNSSLAITSTGSNPISYSVTMNPGWSLDFHPHFAKLEVITMSSMNLLHAYANNPNDSWSPDSTNTTITHNNMNRVDRIVLTDTVNGRTIEDVCVGDDKKKCEITLTVGP